MMARRRVKSLVRNRSATVIVRMCKGRKLRKRFVRNRRAAVHLQKWARGIATRRMYQDKVERAKVQATYKGQLEEARNRLEEEANERQGLLAEKQRLESLLSQAENHKELAARLTAERREAATEYSMLLKQQEGELQALRDELSAANAAKKNEEEARVQAERKRDEAQIQLSVERSNHIKLQRVLELEKNAHVALKQRVKAQGGAVSQGVVGAANAAQLEALQAEVAAMKTKVQHAESRLAHADSERERDKHKLQRTIDHHQLKRREWEREKQSIKRQLENQEAETRKRDKWLEKAKDIIKEYQKRHAPPASPSPGRPSTSG